MYRFHISTHNLIRARIYNNHNNYCLILVIITAHNISLDFFFYIKQQEFTAKPEEFTSQEELLGYLVSVKSYLAM